MFCFRVGAEKALKTDLTLFISSFQSQETLFNDNCKQSYCILIELSTVSMGFHAVSSEILGIRSTLSSANELGNGWNEPPKTPVESSFFSRTGAKSRNNHSGFLHGIAPCNSNVPPMCRQSQGVNIYLLVFASNFTPKVEEDSHFNIFQEMFIKWGWSHQRPGFNGSFSSFLFEVPPPKIQQMCSVKRLNRQKDPQISPT